MDIEVGIYLNANGGEDRINPEDALQSITVAVGPGAFMQLVHEHADDEHDPEVGHTMARASYSSTSGITHEEPYLVVFDDGCVVERRQVKLMHPQLEDILEEARKLATRGRELSAREEAGERPIHDDWASLDDDRAEFVYGVADLEGLA